MGKPKLRAVVEWDVGDRTFRTHPLAISDAVLTAKMKANAVAARNVVIRFVWEVK